MQNKIEKNKLESEPIETLLKTFDDDHDQGVRQLRQAAFDDLVRVGSTVSEVELKERWERYLKEHHGCHNRLSDDGIETMTVKQLKALIIAASLQHTDCVEKPDLQARAREASNASHKTTTTRKTTSSEMFA